MQSANRVRGTREDVQFGRQRGKRAERKGRTERWGDQTIIFLGGSETLCGRHQDVHGRWMISSHLELLGADALVSLIRSWCKEETQLAGYSSFREGVRRPISRFGSGAKG